MQELGRIKLKQGRYEEAEQFFDRALDIRQSAFNDDPMHPDTAESLQWIAYLCGTRVLVRKAYVTFVGSVPICRGIL